MIYRKYSDYLKDKYGEKVYKIPINLPITCPNRDGCISYGGCTFCGEKAAGFESQDSSMPVKEQIASNINHIAKKYAASKYIAYFQNFTNTYMSLNDFEKYINEAILPDIVEIVISTRPDCIAKEYLEVLKKIKEENNIEISIELGLQSTNCHTLKKINRGHSLAEFVDSVMMIKEYNFKICTHLILNLPYDDMDDVIEMSKIISSLRIDFVKLHSLYIVKGTKMAEDYKNGLITICDVNEYKQRIKTFISYLDPNIVIERLFSRAPEEDTIFVNWYTSWWKIRDELEKEMEDENIYQGINFNYLSGSALRNKKFIL